MLKLIIFLAMVAAVNAGMVVGGWKRIEPITDDARLVAHHALELFTNQLNNNLAHRLLEIESVKVQVVAGLNYQFRMKVGRMNCSEQEAKQNADCRVTEHARCHFNVFQDLSQQHELTRHQCAAFGDISQDLEEV